MTSAIEKAAEAAHDAACAEDRCTGYHGHMIRHQWQEAARAVLDAIGYTWRPIESAPRDGSFVDLWFNGKRFADYSWIESKQAWVRIEKMWRSDHMVTSYRHIDGEPTHWMPLPEAPDAALREGE